MSFLIAHICENGHCISHLDRTEIPESQKFCKICGAQIISECQNCHEPIQGKFCDVVSISKAQYIVPKYCSRCGKPYPWTENALATAKELILQDEALSKCDKEQLSKFLPDIIAPTPKTKLAVLYFKKALKSVSKFTAEGLKQFIVDFGCELALRSMGLIK